MVSIRTAVPLRLEKAPVRKLLCRGFTIWQAVAFLCARLNLRRHAHVLHDAPHAKRTVYADVFAASARTTGIIFLAMCSSALMVMSVSCAWTNSSEYSTSSPPA